MWPFNASKGKPTHNEKVLLAYRTFKPDAAEALFPGKTQQADKIIVSLGKIFNVPLESLDVTDYLELLKIYMDVLLRKTVVPMSDTGIIESLQSRHSKFITSSSLAKKAFAYATLNMLNHDFVIESQADIDLLASGNVSEGEKAPTPEYKNADSIEFGFYFENVLELAIYEKLFAGDKVVNWLKGDAYISLFKKGYQLVEEGKYQEAITILKTSLRVNPIGISARFEICECYLKLNNLGQAQKLLIDMSAYLLDVKHIARFYRRMGYIEVEKGNNLAATACFVYSRAFENHSLVEQELQYISVKTGINISDNIDSVAVLRKYNIPILTKRTIDDIQAPR